MKSEVTEASAKCCALQQQPEKDESASPTTPLSSASMSSFPSIEVLVESHCCWIHNALDVQAQIEVFGDILERSKHTDNSQKRPCMNPTPKTLNFDGNTPKLSFGERMGSDTHNEEESPLDSVYYRNVLRKSMSLASSHLPGRILDCNRYSVGVIRYEAPNGSFPEHIDHCKDPNGWVVLLSLGCTARFSVCKGQGHNNNNASKKVVELRSGDVMVFDPSTEAAIVHGVSSILPSTCPQALVRAFGETTMGQHRYGVQCRTSLERPE